MLHKCTKCYPKGSNIHKYSGGIPPDPPRTGQVLTPPPRATLDMFGPGHIQIPSYRQGLSRKSLLMPLQEVNQIIMKYSGP